MIYLDGHSLTLENLVAVARGGTPVALADAARARVHAARAVVNEYAHHDDPTYGINTGFGHFAEVEIPAESLSQLQINLVRSHSAGVGDPLPVDVVRAMMALRANVLAKGFSGIRVETLDLLLELLNRQVHPEGSAAHRDALVGGAEALADIREPRRPREHEHEHERRTQGLAPLRSSAPLMRAHDFIRSRVPAIDHDRSFSPDLRIISDMIVSGALERSCGVDVN